MIVVAGWRRRKAFMWIGFGELFYRSGFCVKVSKLRRSGIYDVNWQSSYFSEKFPGKFHSTHINWFELISQKSSTSQISSSFLLRLLNFRLVIFIYFIIFHEKWFLTSASHISHSPHSMQTLLTVRSSAASRIHADFFSLGKLRVIFIFHSFCYEKVGGNVCVGWCQKSQRIIKRKFI